MVRVLMVMVMNLVVIGEDSMVWDGIRFTGENPAGHTVLVVVHALRSLRWLAPGDHHIAGKRKRTDLTHLSPFSVSLSDPTGPGALCWVTMLVLPSSPRGSDPSLALADT